MLKNGLTLSVASLLLILGFPIESQIALATSAVSNADAKIEELKRKLILAECTLEETIQRIDSATTALESANTRLEIFLSQRGGFNQEIEIANLVGPALALKMELSAWRDGKRTLPPPVQSSAESIQLALETLRKADFLLAHSKAVMKKRSIEAASTRVVIIKNEIDQNVAGLVRSLSEGPIARVALEELGQKVEPFYDRCTGSGFWKVVSAETVTEGETIDVMSDMPTTCEALGPGNAKEYIQMLADDARNGVDDGTGCTSQKISIETDGYIVIDSRCPWQDYTVDFRLTAQEIDASNVQLTSTYFLPDGVQSDIVSVFSQCKM